MDHGNHEAFEKADSNLFLPKTSRGTNQNCTREERKDACFGKIFLNCSHGNIFPR